VSLAVSRSGFPEYLPHQRAAEQWALDRLRRTFELHGFASIETRAVEPLDRLLQKGETDKEIYLLRRLQAGDEAEHSGLGLHFDLTVPLARYVVDNAGHLDFPFRRYQIQKCWRGERPQEGRFREFTQADIDIVGRDELPFHFDIEVAAVMAEALTALPVPHLTMQINNRKLMEGFFRGVGIEDVTAAMRAVDRLDKVPPDAVQAELVRECKVSDEQAQLCLALASIATTGTGFVDQVRELGVRHELLDEGIDELAAVIEGANELAAAGVDITADLRIARGLDYYTGTVFETRMRDFEHLGSVCSGGRYDSLASDGKRTYPGTGISLGVTRLLAPLLARGLLGATRSVPSAVLVALPDEESRPACRRIAQQLRARGIATEVAPAAVAYGKQIKVANRRGIPYVWFPQKDGTYEVRDLQSGEQVPADPRHWQPSAAALRFGIVTRPPAGPPPKETLK
jgi:histidyl-tRNA synthetase